ncbi:hypothetical protein FXO38_28529 [Capsicum annuum]|nr:hypothetical protein FXO38_28529 [Capsicum annuum]
MGLHRNNTSLMITSYSRRCYNLECRKWIDQPPEIVRHCVERYRHMHEPQSRRLVVGNIHVLYFPGRGDVKLGQGFLSICPGLGGQSCLVPIAGGKWQVVAEFIWVQLLMPFILSVLSQGSIGNNLSTSYEVVVWSAYTLPSPDPTMLEYTGYSDGLTPTKVPDILPVNVLKKTDFGPLPNKMTWCLIAHLGCIHPSRTTGSPNLVTTSTLYAESVKFYLKLGSDHLALVSEFEFLEVVGDKKEATEDHTIS